MAKMPNPDQHPHLTELPQLSNADAGSSGGDVGLDVGLDVGVGVGAPTELHRPGIPASDARMYESDTASHLDLCIDLSSQN